MRPRRRKPRPSKKLRPGGALRRVREQAHLSQAALAHRLQCTQQAVAQAERADSNPTLSYLRRFARACGRKLRVEFR